MSVERWTDKENVCVYIHTYTHTQMEYYHTCWWEYSGMEILSNYPRSYGYYVVKRGYNSNILGFEVCSFVASWL